MAELAAAEALLVPPAAAFPTVITIERKVAANALMSLWGNRYSVPPDLVSTEMGIEHRHGSNNIDICAGNRVVATHRLAPAGANRTVRLHEHRAALENVGLAEFKTDRPWRTNLNRPPSRTALTIAPRSVPTWSPNGPPIEITPDRDVVAAAYAPLAA